MARAAHRENVIPGFPGSLARIYTQRREPESPIELRGTGGSGAEEDGKETGRAAERETVRN